MKPNIDKIIKLLKTNPTNWKIDWKMDGIKYWVHPELPKVSLCVEATKQIFNISIFFDSILIDTYFAELREPYEAFKQSLKNIKQLQDDKKIRAFVALMEGDSVD